jgi:hypothetical protein
MGVGICSICPSRGDGAVAPFPKMMTFFVDLFEKLLAKTRDDGTKEMTETLVLDMYKNLSNEAATELRQLEEANPFLQKASQASQRRGVGSLEQAAIEDGESKITITYRTGYEMPTVEDPSSQSGSGSQSPGSKSPASPAVVGVMASLTKQPFHEALASPGNSRPAAPLQQDFSAEAIPRASSPLTIAATPAEVTPAKTAELAVMPPPREIPLEYSWVSQILRKVVDGPILAGIMKTEGIETIDEFNLVIKQGEFDPSECISFSSLTRVGRAAIKQHVLNQKAEVASALKAIADGQVLNAPLPAPSTPLGAGTSVCQSPSYERAASRESVCQNPRPGQDVKVEDAVSHISR